MGDDVETAMEFLRCHISLHLVHNPVVWPNQECGRIDPHAELLGQIFLMGSVDERTWKSVQQETEGSGTLELQIS